MKKRITKAAVIGSGIMGSGIASHLAGIGLEVLLLDIAPKELLPEEEGRVSLKSFMTTRQNKKLKDF